MFCQFFSFFAWYFSSLLVVFVRSFVCLLCVYVFDQAFHKSKFNSLKSVLLGVRNVIYQALFHYQNTHRTFVLQHITETFTFLPVPWKWRISKSAPALGELNRRNNERHKLFPVCSTDHYCFTFLWQSYCLFNRNIYFKFSKRTGDRSKAEHYYQSYKVIRETSKLVQVSMIASLLVKPLNITLIFVLSSLFVARERSMRAMYSGSCMGPLRAQCILGAGWWH